MTHGFLIHTLTLSSTWSWCFYCSYKFECFSKSIYKSQMRRCHQPWWSSLLIKGFCRRWLLCALPHAMSMGEWDRNKNHWDKDPWYEDIRGVRFLHDRHVYMPSGKLILNWANARRSIANLFKTKSTSLLCSEPSFWRRQIMTLNHSWVLGKPTYIFEPSLIKLQPTPTTHTG